MSKVKEILELIGQGYTAQQVASEAGCHYTNVYATAKRYGLKINSVYPRHSDTERQMVCEYRRRGHTARETADHFGLKETWVKEASKNIAQPQYLRPSDFIDHVRGVISARNPGFEYVGNYTGSEGTVDLRCKACGSIVRRSWGTVKHRKASCPICSGIKREQRKTEHEQQKEREREIQRAQDRKRMEAEKAERIKRAEELKAEKLKAKEHPCKVCGTITTRPLYCSDRCANRAINKRKEIRRRIKVSGAMVDNDITLEKLYQRDKGVCYICGMLCEYGDIKTEQGTMIAGDYYPSIDHVIPLAKGGKHAWDNVKLAHRKCNSYKSDTVY